MGDRYALWAKEPGSRIWHGLIDRTADANYKAGCGWELAPLISNMLWPVHPGEPGPPEFERCQWCEAADAIRR